MSAKQYLNALEDIERSNDLDPNNPKIMHRWAKILTSLGRPSEALNVLSQIQPRLRDRQSPCRENAAIRHTS